MRPRRRRTPTRRTRRARPDGRRPGRAAAARRGRRRGHPRPRHLARPGQAPPVPAAGPGAVATRTSAISPNTGSAEKKFIRLADDELRDVDVRPPRAASPSARTTGPTSSTRNLDGRDYQDVYVIDMKTGAPDPGPQEKPLDVHAALRRHPFPLLRRRRISTPTTWSTGKSVNITKDVPGLVRQRGQRHQRHQAARLPGRLDQGRPERPPVGRLGHLERAGQRRRQGRQPDRQRAPRTRSATAGAPARPRREGRRPRPSRNTSPCYGEWTKKAGIGRLEKGKPGVDVLLWDDAGFGGLAKAKKADVFVYTRDTYKDYPDWLRRRRDSSRTAGGSPTPIPQQKDFLWSSGADAPRLQDGPQERHGQAAPGGAFPARQLREGQALPDDRLLLRKDVAAAQPLHRSPRPTASTSPSTRATATPCSCPTSPTRSTTRACPRSGASCRPSTRPWPRASSTGPRSACRAIPGAAIRRPSSSPRPTSPRPWPAPR